MRREGTTKEGFPRTEGWLGSFDGKRASGKVQGRSTGPGSGGGQDTKDRAGQGAANARSRVESRFGLRARVDGSEVQRTDADGHSAEGNAVGSTCTVNFDEPTADMLSPAGRNELSGLPFKHPL